METTPQTLSSAENEVSATILNENAAFQKWYLDKDRRLQLVDDAAEAEVKRQADERAAGREVVPTDPYPLFSTKMAFQEMPVAPGEIVPEVSDATRQEILAELEALRSRVAPEHFAELEGIIKAADKEKVIDAVREGIATFARSAPAATPGGGGPAAGPGGSGPAAGETLSAEDLGTAQARLTKKVVDLEKKGIKIPDDIKINQRILTIGNVAEIQRLEAYIDGFKPPEKPPPYAGPEVPKGSTDFADETAKNAAIDALRVKIDELEKLGGFDIPNLRNNLASVNTTEAAAFLDNELNELKKLAE